MYILATAQGGGGNRTQTPNNTKNKGRDPKKVYVEGLNNIESWRVNKSKGNINRDGQDWYWFPKHRTEGKFDGVYMKHPANKHDK